MTDADWNTSDDVRAMLRHLRSSWRGDEAELERLLHRYYLACCRRLWKLLPLEESRRCVEVAERFLDGQATASELSAAEYDAEGAAFLFERWAEVGERTGLPFRDLEPERVASCIEQFEAIPPEVVLELIGQIDPNRSPTPRELLLETGMLVSIVACYPRVDPKDSIESRFASFLSAPLLREMIGASREHRERRSSEDQP